MIANYQGGDQIIGVAVATPATPRAGAGSESLGCRPNYWLNLWGDEPQMIANYQGGDQIIGAAVDTSATPGPPAL